MHEDATRGRLRKADSGMKAGTKAATTRAKAAPGSSAVQHDAAARGAELGSAAGAAVGAALEGANALSRSTVAVANRGMESAREGAARVASGGLAGALQDVRTAVVHAQEVLDGVVENARERGPAAVAVLSGRRPPRRWPWAVAAAVAGAAAGAGVALVVQRMVGQDAPGAQEPDQLVAVVDADPVRVSPTA